MPFSFRGKKKADSEEIEFELPPEINEQLESGKAAAAKLGTLETDLTTQKTENEALKTRLAELEARVPKPKVEETKEEEPDIFGDPKGTVSRLVSKEIKPLVDLVLLDRARGVQDRLRSRYSDYGYFEAEINKILAKSNGAQLADETYVENCYHVVRSRNIADLQKPEYTNFMERSRGGAPNTTETTKKTRTFDDVSKAYFKRLSLTEEEANKIIDENKYSTIGGAA